MYCTSVYCVLNHVDVDIALGSGSLGRAESRWEFRNPNSRKMAAARAFERFIHPKYLFVVLPLGLFIYYTLSSYMSGSQAREATVLTVKSPSATSTAATAALAPAESATTSANAKNYMKNKDIEFDAAHPNHVRAWFNPRSRQYETPSPWDPAFKSSDVKLVSREIVRDSQPVAKAQRRG